MPTAWPAVACGRSWPETSPRIPPRKRRFWRVSTGSAGRVYLTIDIDVFEVHLCPGTGTPEPGGLGWWPMLGWLDRLVRRNRQCQLIGCDLVEVAVQPGTRVNEFVAARLLAKLLAYHSHMSVRVGCAHHGVRDFGGQSPPYAMHEHYMKIALEEARSRWAKDEVPVGAVIVRDDRVIARAHNQREQLHDPTAHAEMIAITQAAESLRELAAGRLHALRDARAVPDVRRRDSPGPDSHGRLRRDRSRRPARSESLYRMLDDPRLNHQCVVVADVLAEPCGRILSEFFQEQRRLGKK